MHLPNVRAASLLALSSAASLVSGLGQKPIVSFTESADSFQIAGGAVKAGQILVSSNDYWGVIRAAGDLAVDFGRVTGTNYSLSNGVQSSAPASYVYNPINNMNNTFVSARSRAQLVYRQSWACVSTPFSHTIIVRNYGDRLLPWPHVRGSLSSRRCHYCRHNRSLERDR
jgi:hypothetical protein